MTTKRESGMIDISTPEIVEVTFDPNFRTLWVNVEGVCKLRIQNIPRHKLFMGKIDEEAEQF